MLIFLNKSTPALWMSIKTLFEDDAYLAFLKSTVAAAHDGYFSRDKKGNFVNKTERGTSESADSSAYDLIMKDKERLLDRKNSLRCLLAFRTT